MTNEQNIIAVPVPVDAKITGTLNFMGVPSLRYDMPDKRVYKSLVPDVPHDYLIPMDAFLGCVSFKDGEYIFDFDPSQLVQCISLPARLWKNYHGSTYWTDQCDSPEKSFVTRLQSMGHYRVNPVPYNPYSEAWIEAESKCLRPDQKLAVMKIGG